MHQSRLLIGSVLFVVLLAGCKDDASPPAVSASEATSPVTAAEPAIPEAASAPAVVGAPTPAADAGFSVESVPLSTAVLPPFPFFEIPEGLTGTVADEKNTISFDRHFFLA